jgi:multidrug efflux pump subunit AcrB
MAGRLAALFATSKLTPLLVLASLLLGGAAIWLLPREEEPQIKVPMIDVLVTMPGASAQELAERVTRPMAQLLWEIEGVEYLYSTSSPGQSLVIVRFKVGEDVERSLVKLNQKLQANFDRIPHGVSQPLIKPHAIDDVPILALTFHSSTYDHYTLRRLAAEVQDAVKQVPETAETRLIGGYRRQVQVLLDPVRLAARNLSPAGLVPLLTQANRQYASGAITADNRVLAIETGGFLHTAEEVGQVVVGVYAGRPVYLREVATLVDGPEEPRDYVLHGGGAHYAGPAQDEPAVTLTVAKRPGTNAIAVAHAVLARVAELRGRVIPADVSLTITRHYGETAAEKSNELLLHMGIAVASVALLIWLALGFREALVVAIAIPATLALTLLVFYLYGYTLNRITLFALIFSIGILVDDAIVVLENIVRHQGLPEAAGQSRVAVAVAAVAEVGNPTILATLAVIAAILPMALVGGLMGPYMRPIPVGASAAMAFSLLIAFTVTPWAALWLLRHHQAGGHDTPARESWTTRLYRVAMAPLIGHAWARWLFLAAIVALLGYTCHFVYTGFVKVKMLPFDNKNEFQLILNLPEGTALEQTTQAAREIAAIVRREPEVAHYQIYAGTAAPMNFNGLVRHYFLRRGAHVADIQVNLLPKQLREADSHAIAKRIRPAAAAVAVRYGGRLAIAEVPPGPPVLQTLVAEVYGPTPEARLALATKVRDLFAATPGVVDVDWYVEAPQTRAQFVIDKEKAALHGISAETISQTLRLAVDGLAVELLHDPREKEDVTLFLRLPREARTTPVELLNLRVRAGDANALPEPGPQAQTTPLVALRELVRVVEQPIEQSLYHKNLLPVTYVIADVAGEIESPVYAILALNRELRRLDARPYGGTARVLPVYNAKLPTSSDQPALKWDGEWQITLEVFRDLGLAFGAVLVLIYLLMVGWFRSFLTPLIVMAAIPFSLVGILPAHGAMGAFFTATSMIGFMAGAGIVVRNSIILIDFIELRRREGMPLAQAVVDAGAVRFRPMLLTALAVVVGAAVILFDPIFQGLALSLMAGEVASLLISRMAVPVLYYMAYHRHASAPA